MPTRNDLVPVDPLLTNVSIKFLNMGFVASKIFPRFKVALVSGTYFKYGKQNFDIPDARRAAKSAYNRVEFKLTNATYACHRYGLEDIIDDDERAVQPVAINLDTDTTEFVTDMLMLAGEKRVVDIVTDTAVITNNTTLSGTSQWSDYSNSDPIGDVRTGRNTINAAIGKDPNKMIISREVYDQLGDHPAFLERIKYTQAGILTPQLLAAVFNLDEVVVAHARYNSSKKGQTESLTRLWGKHCLLTFSENSPGLRKISLGYNFEFEPRQTQKFRHKDNIGDVIRVKEYIDEELISADCGYLIKDAVA